MLAQGFCRQFREIPGIMEGTSKPEYGRCVDIVTKAALHEMVMPGFLAVFVPLLVGFFLGPKATCRASYRTHHSRVYARPYDGQPRGSWDNAKKLIEDGQHGGKGSEAHKAAIVGDTVGDPFKDTAGPALNALIKVVNMVAIFTSLIIGKGLF